jgi:hypothetical protein
VQNTPGEALSLPGCSFRLGRHIFYFVACVKILHHADLLSEKFEVIITQLQKKCKRKCRRNCKNAASLQKLFYEYQTKCRRTIAKWAEI